MRRMHPAMPLPLVQVRPPLLPTPPMLALLLRLMWRLVRAVRMVLPRHALYAATRDGVRAAHRRGYCCVL